MNKPLNNKIFILLTVLVLVTTTVLMAVVWDNTKRSIEKNVNERIELAKTIVIRELVNRQNFVIQNANVLLDDFAFKRLLAAKNSDDIVRALASFRMKMDAAFIKIQSANDNFEVSNGRLATLMSTQDEVVAKRFTREDGDFANLLVLEQTLVWVIWTPIFDNAGNVSAYASMGFVVGELYAQSIKQVAGTDVSILVNAQRSFVVSTLDSTQSDLNTLEQSLVTNHNYSLLYLNPLSNSNNLLSKKFSLPNLGDISPIVYLSINSERTKADLLNLLLTITAVALIVLLGAISAGRMLAKQITRPIEYIAKYAVDIAKGNYSKSLKLETSSSEMAQLIDAFKTMENDVQKRESEIAYQAEHDMLTGLYNRNYMSRYINNLLTEKQVFQAIGINIQRFRNINDVFGYQYGDLCLQELAKRIVSSGGKSARLEGGEILWIPNTSLNQEQIKQAKTLLEAPVQGDKVNIPLHVSMGIINCPNDTRTAEDLYRRLNIVIDQAQLEKSMIVEFEHILEANYLRRLAVVQKLEKAIKQKSDDIHLCFQPKLNLKTGKVDAVEALTRWHDKDLGHIPPDEFIRVAEQAGLINLVTKRVFDMAIESTVMLKEQNINVCIAINISAQDIMHDGFVEYLLAMLEQQNLTPAALSLELTESAIMEEPQKSIQQLTLLREAGFSIAIDDFGTGYSSFEYITQLPIDTIKIDKCFVMPLALQEGEQAVCKAILSVASSFNMTVVAEGVEDEASLQLLKAWGCDYAQGFHLARPMKQDVLSVWFEKNSELLSVD